MNKLQNLMILFEINFRNGIQTTLDVVDNKLVLFLVEEQEEIVEVALEDLLQDAPTVIKTSYRIHRLERLSDITEGTNSAPRSRLGRQTYVRPMHYSHSG